MKILAKNSQTYITEDETSWIINWYDGSKPEKIDKTRQPDYPLALVYKWGYEAVDIDRLNELDRQE